MNMVAYFEVDTWPSHKPNIFNCVTKYFSLFYKIFLPCSGEAVCEVESVGEDGLHVGEVGGAVGGRGQPGRHGEVDTAGPGSIAHHTGGGLKISATLLSKKSKKNYLIFYH